LVALGISFVAPYPTADGKLFLATELAMLAFVVAAHWRVASLRPVFPALLVLAVPTVAAYISPFGDYSLLVSGLIFTKLAIFVYFVYVFAIRCRNPRNITWSAQWVILPVALLLCISALVDRYTESSFFITWHQLVTFTSDSYMARLIEEAGVEYASRSQIAGFATRSSDIFPWALLGVTAAFWLWHERRMRASSVLVLAMGLFGSAFSMPKRGAIFLAAIVLFTFLITSSRRRMGRRYNVVAVVVTLVGIGVVANVMGLGYEQDRAAASDVDVAISAPSYYRLAAIGVWDDRVANLYDEILWIVTRPRVLLLGTGWMLTAGYWSRPHDTYVALVLGGGLISLLAVALGLAHLLKDRRLAGVDRTPTPLGSILLVSLCVEMGMNGYLFARLEFPASTLVIWAAWLAAVYRPPMATSGRSAGTQRAVAILRSPAQTSLHPQVGR